VLVEELEIPGVGVGLLRRPELGVPLQGGIVALHGASRSERSQPLFDHLAQTSCSVGHAVLSYDRRAKVNGSDVPLADQSADARAALAALGKRLQTPVGLFAFSQGAWAACLAAGDEPLAVEFLILLGCSGVSPAAQMRFFTDELLRRAGFDARVRDRARRLRLGLEQTFRGAVDPAVTSAALAAAKEEPWFSLTYLPTEMPTPDHSWDDMDFDPSSHVARITCPTLLIYGADEECVPAHESEAAWRSHGHRDLTVVYLPACGHFPVVGGAGRPEPTNAASFTPDYTAALTAWLTR
jgi:pimeloyl-ACP methyl ester carboxylesterase